MYNTIFTIPMFLRGSPQCYAQKRKKPTHAPAFSALFLCVTPFFSFQSRMRNISDESGDKVCAVSLYRFDCKPPILPVNLNQVCPTEFFEVTVSKAFVRMLFEYIQTNTCDLFDSADFPAHESDNCSNRVSDYGGRAYLGAFFASEAFTGLGAVHVYAPNDL